MILFEALSSIIIIFAAFYGLFLGGCMKNPNHSHNLLSYYTNLSNIIVLIYQLCVLASLFVPKSGFYCAVRSPILQYTVTNTIVITFLVYHFILYPAIKIKRESMTDAEKSGGVITPNNLCVHYIVPLGSLAFWLLFADKNLPFYCVFSWLAVPAAYSVYILSRAAHGINIYGKDTPYPYFFIDRSSAQNALFGTLCFPCLLFSFWVLLPLASADFIFCKAEAFWQRSSKKAL